MHSPARGNFNGRGTPEPFRILRIEIGNRGRQMRLYIDSALVADSHGGPPDEPRRTVTLSRDSTAGVTYLRYLSSALPESVDVDLAPGACCAG